MFTNPTPSPIISAATPPPPAPPHSSSRSGRLRGLSSLRSYTQHHLSSHTSSNPRSSQRTSLSRSMSYPVTQGSPQPSDPSSKGTPRTQREPNLFSGGKHSTSFETHTAGSTSGWLPTVGGQSGISRIASQPQSTSAVPPSAELTGPVSSNKSKSSLFPSMARHKTNSSSRGSGARLPDAQFSTEAIRFSRLDGPQNTEPSHTPQGSTSQPMNQIVNVESSDALVKPKPPMIRFYPHQDGRNGRPSLQFSPITRTLPYDSAIIRVGRYSEREGIPIPNPSEPSDAPVGFKSKVVSRKHCEFLFQNGQWQIRDVRSSSGTFLNHIRLSQPNTESRLYPVKDGDIVQLGIDFRGGEEMIFRCVKIRIECNRTWQKSLNAFK